MKTSKLLLTSMIFTVVVGAVAVCAPAICQSAGLIPTGNCSLPQGHYILTNLQSGQAVYLEIDATGKMLAQDPRALQWSVTPVTTGYGQYGAGSAPAYTPPPASAVPAAPATAGGAAAADTAAGTTPQNPGLFGGLI